MRSAQNDMKCFWSVLLALATAIFANLIPVWGEGSSPTTPISVTPLEQAQLWNNSVYFFEHRDGHQGFQDPASFYLTETDTDLITKKTTTFNLHQSFGLPNGDYWRSPDPWTNYPETWVSSSDSSAKSTSYNQSVELSHPFTIEIFKQFVEAQAQFSNSWSRGWQTPVMCFLPNESSNPRYKPSFYGLGKSQYKWKTNNNLSETLFWDIQFTPYSDISFYAIGAVQHELHSWSTAGAAESPVYTIDPTQLHDKQNGTYNIVLLRFELSSDLNNDGTINSADFKLRTEGAKSGASDEQREKATEYMFGNDNLSNGAWDKDDSDASKPADAKNDDDVEEISTICTGTWGAVWFEHPAIDKLAFYKSKECKATEKMTFPFALTTEQSGRLPEKLYVRTEGTNFTEQAEGDLVMKFGKADKSETWAEDKLKFTAVSQIGDAKYFNAARDYMLEKNTRLHVRYFKPGQQQIRITAMRHESTDMKVIETFHSEPKIFGMPAVVTASQDYYDLLLNGNFCYFGDGGAFDQGIGMLQHNMTDRCHGGCVVAGAKNLATSVGGTHSFEQANAEYLSASGKGTFAITTGIVPLNPVVHSAALGGFGSNLVGGLYNTHPWFGLAEVGVTGAKKKLIFTVTQTAATTQYPLEDLVARLKASGQTLCIAGDGGSSTACAHRIEGDVTRVKFAGEKHYPGHYWINTYVGFKSDKPRQ